NNPPRSLPRHVAITGIGNLSQRAVTESRGLLRWSSRISTQSAPVKSDEKTSSKLRGVRGTHSAPGFRISRPQLRAEIALASVGQDGEQAFTVPEFGSD